MPEYPPIAHHGLIGDLQTTALVSATGAVDWFCAPRVDSPSIFASLLDQERGGHFTIAPALDDVTVRQLYLPDTAVLITRFLTPDGVGEVVDFMPVSTHPDVPTDRHRLVRALRVVRGTLTFDVRCAPRFDYGRAPHTLTLDGHAATFHGPGLDVHLRSSVPLEADGPEGPDGRGGRDVRATVTLTQGQTAGIVLETSAPGGAAPEPVTEQALDAELEATRVFWHRWIRRCRYRGRWQNMVNRSAITLKLLIYAPSGAPVAAATMGLPEQIGGERNWDYRYTWIRDASFSVRVLLDLGYVEEADAFRRWLGDRFRGPRPPGGEPMQIMYRVDGDPRLPEEVLGHLSGYRDSFPVRAGNGAADQLQLDIYGEFAYAMTHSPDLAELAGYEGWKGFAALLDWLAGHWDRPDEGIWETRGGRKDFTYSRVMCWVALDRGIRLATQYARPADIPHWTAQRDAILVQVMERGWNPERGAFVQHYDSAVLDASLLLMPRVGFISPRAPSWLATLDAMDRELVIDSLVHRYNPEASPDGLRGSEGTFSLCSFLYVEALARAGRLEQARYAMDKMLTYANHVGLFAEEIGPTGEQLGNFPQAFTHLALITAALALDEELDKAADRD
ncbi:MULTISPECIES: glycoside hydrolase family 15 protein [Streptomyces]|uniref:Glucoamylase n=1 Tax=Streptomyces venezuelae (strain ATCC 10712 / CBS 650.69 / DSM 40230 / JCM 4526 / NBRC 13096 / PD 04745) TaxID=953739 RepID=F2R7B8_STRVP|nr:glycoside hydrolase family 15 protein [Streptomyces venezuelae]APE19980.1 glucoamylase [Streptomyces venezuelae]QER97384.1 glycoside hydrolase family 15 protein [Streptomyces venezuelae ATCC 10712]CCA53810.1 Glucoamylase [Streptomyces venezuelae ATCC 10712]